MLLSFRVIRSGVLARAHRTRVLNGKICTSSFFFSFLSMSRFTPWMEGGRLVMGDCQCSNNRISWIFI